MIACGDVEAVPTTNACGATGRVEIALESGGDESAGVVDDGGALGVVT